MAITPKKYASNKRYDEKAYDRVSVLFPKGTKDRIKSTGRSFNGLASRALCSEVDRIEKGLAAVNIPQELYSELSEHGDPDALAADAVWRLLKEISV